MKFDDKLKIISFAMITLVLALSMIQLVQSASQVIIELSPPMLSMELGEEFEISIKVDPGDYGVSGGEINLAYDPDLLEVIEISPGDLFGPDPLVGIEKVDNETGTVKYALARRGMTSAPTPPGSFARIKFRTLNVGIASIELTFVGLANQDFKDIPKEEMRIENSTVVICPGATGTITLTTTETISTTIREVETSFVTTTTTVTSMITAAPQTVSYLGGGLAAGLIMGIIIGYIALRRRA